MFERLPADLKQQALLRVEALRLAGGDAEEVGIEAVDGAKETAVAGGDPSGRVRVGIEKRVVVPAVARHLADGIRAGLQQTPESRRAVAAARYATAHADHRDGLALGRVTRGELALGLLDHEEGALDRAQALGGGGRVVHCLDTL